MLTASAIALFSIQAATGPSRTEAQVPAPPSNAVTVIDSAEIAPLDDVGSCVTGDGREIDLHRVLFLDDRPVTFDAEGRTYRARVEREALLIDAVDPDGEARATYRNRIDYQIQEDGGGSLDVQIQLAFAEGRVAVYWRETWRNRIYNQGLYRITGQGVALLCRGRGGRQVEE